MALLLIAALALQIREVQGHSNSDHNSYEDAMENRMGFTTYTTDYTKLNSSLDYDAIRESKNFTKITKPNLDILSASSSYLDSQIIHDINMSCPGSDYIVLSPNTEILYLGNLTDCGHMIHEFPFQQSIVYGMCGDSRTFCYMQVEAPEPMTISAAMRFPFNASCGPLQWAVYMFESRPPCLPFCVSSATHYATCVTGMMHNRYRVSWNASRAYLLFHNNPSVEIQLEEYDIEGFKVHNISPDFGYIQLFSLTKGVWLSQINYWTDIQVPIRNVIEIKFRNFARGHCQVYCRLFQGKIEKHPDLIISMCRNHNDKHRAFNTSLLTLNFLAPESYAVSYFSLHVFYVIYNSDDPSLGVRSFDCSQYGIYYKTDCLWNGFCEHGELEKKHCPQSSTGCMKWVSSINKCLQIVSRARPLTYKQVYDWCQAEGGNLVTFKTPKDHAKGTNVIKANINAFEYELKYIAIGLISGWQETVHFMYRMSWRWSDKTIIYDLFHLEQLNRNSNKMPGTIPRTAALSNGLIQTFHRYIRQTTEAFVCEYQSAFEEWYKVTSVTFLVVGHLSEWQYTGMHVCPRGHVTHGFLVCDVQSHCGHAKPPPRCTLEQSGHHMNQSTPSENALTSVTLFTCDDDFTTVLFTVVCDFRHDCPDHSDESFCVHPPCKGFKCDNGQCVSVDKRCNGYSDCPDESDEATALCGHIYREPSNLSREHNIINLDGTGYFTHERMTANESCPETHYQCTSDPLCLPVYTRCNGYNDCITREDEANCDTATCPGYYRCRSSAVCVHVHHVCDGWGQCPQRDDEWLCDMTCPGGCLCQGLSFVCPQPFSAHLHPQLRYMDAAGSGMTLIHLSSNLYLVQLTLYHCSLQSLPDLPFANMRFLDLSHNNITTLAVSSLLSMKNLRVLLLSDNPLVSLVPDADNQIQTALKKIDLSSTFLTAFDSGSLLNFPKLKSLNLSSSGIQVIGPQGFKRTQQLMELDLRNNKLNNFSLDMFGGLNELSIIYSSSSRVCCQKIISFLTNMPVCESPEPIISSCEQLISSKLHTFVSWMFSILSVLGVISSFMNQCVGQNPFQGNTLTCLFTLQISYLCMGTHTSIVSIAHSLLTGDYLLYESAWTSNAACKTAGVLSLLSGEMSLLVTWLMTVDHVMVLCLPFSYLRLTPKSTGVVLVVCCLLALLLTSLLFLHSHAPANERGIDGVCLLLFLNKHRYHTGSGSMHFLTTVNVIFSLMTVAGQTLIRRATPKYRMTAGAEMQSVLCCRSLVSNVSLSTSGCWMTLTMLSAMTSTGLAEDRALWVSVMVVVTPLSSSLYPLFYWWSWLHERRQHDKEQRVLRRLKARGPFWPNCSDG